MKLIVGNLLTLLLVTGNASAGWMGKEGRTSNIYQFVWHEWMVNQSSHEVDSYEVDSIDYHDANYG